MTTDKTPNTIKTMFDVLAQKYDFMNNIISLGLHEYIKKESVRLLEIKPDFDVIDLCSGTGDLALIVKNKYPNTKVTGIDFSENMVKIAKAKGNDILFLQGDVTNLPFPDGSFDVVMIGFGLRNIQNAERAVEEAYRILKCDGQFMHLDFGEKNIFGLFFNILVLIFAKIFSKNYSAYSYLIKSKREFLQPEDLIKDFEKKGFKFKIRKDFLFGVISCQVMKK